MKIGTIELASGFARAGAALIGTILLAVTVSISTAACGLFNSVAGAGNSRAARGGEERRSLPVRPR